MDTFNNISHPLVDYIGPHNHFIKIQVDTAAVSITKVKNRRNAPMMIPSQEEPEIQKEAKVSDFQVSKVMTSACPRFTGKIFSSCKYLRLKHRDPLLVSLFLMYNDSWR